MVGVDKINSDAASGVKSGIDLPNEVQGLCRPPSGSARCTEMGTRANFGVDRPGPGFADARLDGGLHGRTTADTRDAASEGRRRRQRVAGAAAAADRDEIDPRAAGDATGYGGRHAAGTGERRESGRRPGQDRIGPVISNTGRAGQDTKTARPRLEPSSAAHIRKIAGVVFAEHGIPRHAARITPT